MSKEANMKVCYFFWNSFPKFYLLTIFREANVNGHINVLINCYSFSEWFITFNSLASSWPCLLYFIFFLFSIQWILGLFGPLLKSVKGFSTSEGLFNPKGINGPFDFFSKIFAYEGLLVVD